MQKLSHIIDGSAKDISLCFNTSKTVCMIFNPFVRHKVVSKQFPLFTLAGCQLKYVNQFKYLGHIINDTMCDNDDIRREIRSLFCRTNILFNRFKRCSVAVKAILSR